MLQCVFPFMQDLAQLLVTLTAVLVVTVPDIQPHASVNQTVNCLVTAVMTSEPSAVSGLNYIESKNLNN